MSGRPSKAQEQARAAYEKSGCTMPAKELAKKYKVALSTIYRAPWWKNRNAAQAAQQSEGE